ncbi:LysR family transcriptional regulator [Sphingomonas psychrolutea]|uniref:LysR family transcriptional regulator n=1 Tax=Sphingomonas psychrolutea TaxID=1259676 RepID=A0ABQ1H0B5_9SPHN|nr:LysR family transcriptional regulator [Sphingomonas psychrolutea]GGA53643.1 LysR family transcriptional regulator [Sphingomonas psychrolutea]
MLEKHLRAIDLNLLPVLEALLRHRNATRAGAEVGLSQPAMSRALGRLRHLLDDPLLVRAPGGQMLSPRAEALRQPLAAMLTDLRGLLSEPAFDPAAERRTLRLAMTDAQATLLLAPLVVRVAAAAPGVIVEWVPISAGLPERMLSGAVDLTLALDTTPLPRGAASEPLMEDALSVVVRAGHPCGGVWPIANYGAYPSVIVSLLGDRASDMDAELAAAAIERPIAAIVPTFRAAAEIVARTDAVTTISHAFAQSVAGPLALRLIAPPLAHDRLGVVAVWATYRGSDPLLTWFRAMLQSVTQERQAARCVRL